MPDVWNVVSGLAAVVAAVVAVLAWLAASKSAAEVKRANDRNDSLDRKERDARIAAHITIQENADGFVLAYDGDDRVTEVRVLDMAGVLVGSTEPFEFTPHRSSSGRFTLYEPKVRPHFILLRWAGMESESVKVPFPRRFDDGPPVAKLRPWA